MPSAPEKKADKMGLPPVCVLVPPAVSEVAAVPTAPGQIEKDENVCLSSVDGGYVYSCSSGGQYVSFYKFKGVTSSLSRRQCKKRGIPKVFWPAAVSSCSGAPSAGAPPVVLAVCRLCGIGDAFPVGNLCPYCLDMGLAGGPTDEDERDFLSGVLAEVVVCCFGSLLSLLYLLLRLLLPRAPAGRSPGPRRCSSRCSRTGCSCC